MNFNNILTIFLILFLTACQQFDNDKKVINNSNYLKYSNTGFTLIYDEQLKKDNKISKKIDDRALVIFHKKIKKNSFVKITNPANNKSIIAKVISNNAQFSDFYNSVITTRIANDLSIDLDEPYIDLVLISENSTFIAKKAKTFDEEKNVAEKAPVDGITIDNLGDDLNKKNKVKKHNFLYSIKIADFYYKDSAENMILRIKKETNLKNLLIKKLSKTKYRVLLGPFSDIKKLEQSFDEIKLLEFEKKLFPNQVLLLHGKTEINEKEKILNNFQKNKFKILVSTTIIEVGIDFPNANVIIIENANKFGLSQLHQLRGRVGRGDKESSCILMFKSNLSENAKKRINILKKSNDGFFISEEDMKIRGFGDLLGFKQSGIKNFKLADPIHNSDLFLLAEKEIKRIENTNEDISKFKPLIKLYDRADIINDIA